MPDAEAAVSRTVDEEEKESPTIPPVASNEEEENQQTEDKPTGQKKRNRTPGLVSFIE